MLKLACIATTCIVVVVYLLHQTEVNVKPKDSNLQLFYQNESLRHENSTLIETENVDSHGRFKRASPCNTPCATLPGCAVKCVCNFIVGVCVKGAPHEPRERPNKPPPPPQQSTNNRPQNSNQRQHQYSSENQNGNYNNRGRGGYGNGGGDYDNRGNDYSNDGGHYNGGGRDYNNGGGSYYNDGGGNAGGSHDNNGKASNTYGDYDG